jgi:GAF domain-containing protein
VSLTDSWPAWPPAPHGEDITRRRLLQSIVDVARCVFAAAAASVFVVDAASGDLVFEAVSGAGEEWLVGTRFPSGTGVAGWVAISGQPMLIDDVADSPRFAKDAAASTGYVPRSIMAAPLLSGGECLGVLEVLDRGSRQRGDLGDVDLLGLMSTQVATAVDLLVQLSAVKQDGPWQQASQLNMVLLRRVAERLPTAADQVSATVTKLLTMADELLAQDDPAAATFRA